MANIMQRVQALDVCTRYVLYGGAAYAVFGTILGNLTKKTAVAHTEAEVAAKAPAKTPAVSAPKKVESPKAKASISTKKEESAKAESKVEKQAPKTPTTVNDAINVELLNKLAALEKKVGSLESELQVK